MSREKKRKKRRESSHISNILLCHLLYAAVHIVYVLHYGEHKKGPWHGCGESRTDAPQSLGVAGWDAAVWHRRERRRHDANMENGSAAITRYIVYMYIMAYDVCNVRVWGVRACNLSMYVWRMDVYLISISSFIIYNVCILYARIK